MISTTQSAPVSTRPRYGGVVVQLTGCTPGLDLIVVVVKALEREIGSAAADEFAAAARHASTLAQLVAIIHRYVDVI